MSIEACAELVRSGDADRFLSVMTARPAQRAPLMVLYAFNLEVARTAWVSPEPMIAEMRLQFWADVLDDLACGKPPPAHEVAGALADLVQSHDLPLALLQGLVAARRFDIYKDAHADAAAFDGYIDATSGNLMWSAARVLGADASAEVIVRDFAYGAGVAALLRAIPALVASGRYPLIDGSNAGVQALAGQGLRRINAAKAARRQITPALTPVLRAGWMAIPLLKQAMRDPAAVAEGRLGLSDAAKRFRVMQLAFRNRW